MRLPKLSVGKTMRIAATGHRPPRLGLSYRPDDNKLLTMFAKEILDQAANGYGMLTVISGMAQGWDQAVAHAAILLKFPLIAALPFEGQESRWPTAGKERYNAILKHAQEVKLVCPGGFENKKYLTRDEWMVDNADGVLALWDGVDDGGTSHTVHYAEGMGMTVHNVWVPFESYCWKHRNGGKPN